MAFPQWKNKETVENSSWFLLWKLTEFLYLREISHFRNCYNFNVKIAREIIKLVNEKAGKLISVEHLLIKIMVLIATINLVASMFKVQALYIYYW